MSTISLDMNTNLMVAMLPYLLLASLLVGLEAAGPTPDLTVCNPQNYLPYQGPPLPKLPDQLTWRIEGNFVNKKYTLDFHQFIDYTNNKMALRSYTQKAETITLFKYDTNELISLKIPNDPLVPGLSTSCSISPLSSNFLAVILGETDINNRTHVSRPLAGMRMDESKSIRYVGKDILPDGVRCNVWEGCRFIPGIQTTMKITWYFSDPTEWYSAMGPRDVPMVMIVSGTTRDRQTQMMRSFDHRYNYADFRPYLSQGAVSSFQIPEGVVCVNEVNTVPLPKVPKYFTVSAEILDGVSQYMSWIKEHYDSGLGLTKYEYKEPQGSSYGHNDLIRVHDFNTGVAYVMDPVHNNCSITPLNRIGYDDKMVDSSLVRIRTPEEFLDLNHTYAYVGQRVDRGITCDVWVTSRTDYPPPGGFYATTWEQYFTATVAEAVGDNTEYSIPVKLRISSANPPILKTYNFFDFDERQSTFHNYDVSMCFSPDKKADYLLVVPGTDRDLIFTNIVIFRRLFVISVMASAFVSPIRVTNVEVDFNNTGLLLTFTLLDKPGISGDVVHPVTEPDLDGAMAKLNSSIDSGDFSILLSDPAFGEDVFESLSVKSYSYTRMPAPPSSPSMGKRKKRSAEDHITRVNVYDGSKGFSVGTTAGLAIGTLFGGFLIGFVIVFLIFHAKSKPAGASSFDNPLTKEGVE